MSRLMAESRAECDRMNQEKAEMKKEIARFREECLREMSDMKSEMTKKSAESKADCDRLATEKKEMAQKNSQFRREMEEKMAKEKEDMKKQTEQSRRECERMAEEKVAMSKEMAAFRAELETNMAEEKARVQEAKTSMAKRLEEARLQNEQQLQTERDITSSIMHAIRELPPLQAAMELGDLRLLEEELRKWTMDSLPERFGDCKGVVEAVVKLGQERLVTWRGVEHGLKHVLKEVEKLPSSVSALQEACHRLFRALKEAQLTKMDLHRSEPKALDRMCEVLSAWQERSMSNSNKVQRSIIRKVITWPQLGPFDFADLDICLRLVDRGGAGSDIFLSRAQSLVDDASTAPKDLRPLLSHVETMLFFLKYTKSESLDLTHQEFRKQAGLDPIVREYLAWAEREYPAGKELVHFQQGQALMDDKEVGTVLEELRKTPKGPKPDSLGIFREIFFQWAQSMRSKFDLLVLPHHTQVVTLMAFRRFLEAEKSFNTPHALIAQVGTGEGKSMIVAGLAIYVAVFLRKKVHVVVDDETLLERDFWTFKRLFDTFQVPIGSGKKGDQETRPLSAILCVSAEKLAESKQPCLSQRVDPDADICYCEAKHVQSFYASIARGEKRDFDGYDGRVLILDEVDALVIDEEPNEAFVYPNKELSQMATIVAEAFAKGSDVQEAVRGHQHPATQRVVREMTKEWSKGKDLKVGEDFVYAKEVGRYCKVHAGRVDPKSWSLALECRNFQDQLTHDILFQERMFVMSRPRVFRRYHRILGLSGSIGSKAEREFLKQTYHASFFEVPPFLKTCRGSPFHEPVPAKLGELQQSLYVEPTVQAQVQRLCEVSLEARENVPVLLIAKDRAQADSLVECLRTAARSRGLGHVSDDAVRSLSRTLYEADPEQWKENLNRATLPLGENSAAGNSKTWRITVTDPRGGRGIDYRVDHTEVDEHGGMLLVPTSVPTSQREWTQWLGRTSRQDRRGQFCPVLCGLDYVELGKKFGQSLPAGGIEVIDTVLQWADQEVAQKIQGSAALYNVGVRVNELCENLFGRSEQLLKDPYARESVVDVCQRMRWMSVRDVDDAFRRIKDFDPSSIPTEAKDLGPAEQPPPRTIVQTRGGPVTAVPKVVIFCLDWSISMMSRDTGTPKTRFQVCMECVNRILKDQVRDSDVVGIVAFGPTVETVFLPAPKARGGAKLEKQLAGMAPQMAGGTAFYDAVMQCLQMLTQPGTTPSECQRWLVCLTDGDDHGSKTNNSRGQLVTALLDNQVPANLNMMMITVGQLRDQNVRVIEHWVDRVGQAGGIGQHLSPAAAKIDSAFSVVAEFLAAEVGGANEC